MITETYIKGKGILYKLDPRPKIIELLAITITTLFLTNVFFQLCLYCFLLILSLQALGLKKAFLPIKSIFPVLIITAILTPLFNKDGNVVFFLNNFLMVTNIGIILTIILVLRFLIITTAFFMFFSTTLTSDLILALRSFGLPHRAALTVTISLRYIPDMFNTYYRITDAHKLRITETDIKQHRNFLFRIKRLFPVLISVLIHAVKEIPTLAMALDSKGFDRKNKRTSCNKLLPWNTIYKQIICSILFAFLLGITPFL